MDLSEKEIMRRRKASYQKRKRQILAMRILVLFCSLLVIVLAGVLLRLTILKNGFSIPFLPSSPGTQNNTEVSIQIADDGNATASADGSQNADPSQPGDAASGTDGSQGSDAASVNDGSQGSDASSGNDGSQGDAAVSGTDGSQENNTTGDTASLLAQAERMAAGYDYSGAIGLLSSSSFANDPAVTQAIAGYQSALDSCVAVDVTTVPHIFYHSLVNDPSRAFNAELLGQSSADGMNAWMTTVDEFDKITQQLYERGYVYVRLRDLVVETVNADGSVSFEPNTNLLLPEGKKAIVLSVDDLSYYHSYEAASYPDHLVLDENGKVKCHYVDASGNESVGDYDVVPRLNTFLEEHPDGAYKGARGLIALTGYNGVFGYRTDIDYEVQANLMSDQAAWLADHPDFDRQEEIAQATVIANALKDEGWEFASHTWGHLSVTGKTAEQLRVDNEKWIDNVANIVGTTDTIIFAHGNDIGDWTGYSSDNEQYAYYSSAGYHFYCNVDGSVPYWVQITGSYVRQGRIDLDGYMLYQASQGATNVIDNLIDAAYTFDSRRPTPVIANGQG